MSRNRQRAVRAVLQAAIVMTAWAGVAYADEPCACPLGKSTPVRFAAKHAGVPPKAVAAVPAKQVQYDPALDLTFSAAPTADGGVMLSGRSGELSFNKTVYQDGRFRLVVEARRDKVEIAAGPDELQVTRHRRTVTIVPTAATDDDYDKVRQVLAGSRAIRTFRMLAASLEDSPSEDTAPVIATMLSDVVIGMLDGDISAPQRFAHRISRRHQRRAKPVKWPTDCYFVWEDRVMASAADVLDCISSFSTFSLWRAACGFRWTLQVESYWFQMLGCSAIPLKM